MSGRLTGRVQRRHHGEGDLTGPALLGGIDHRGVISGTTRPNLVRFCAVSSSRWARTQALALAALDDLAGDRREHDRFARAGRCDAERVAAGWRAQQGCARRKVLWRGRRRMAVAPYCAQLGRPGGTEVAAADWRDVGAADLWAWPPAGVDPETDGAAPMTCA